jgi:protein-tyrosine phosphatase
MQSFLFVCLGNICRSPLAEGIARKIAEDRALGIVVDSAGTGDWHIGEPPCRNSIKVAKEHNIDISSLRARVVQQEDFERFEYIVALDESNLQTLQKMGAKNVVKLGDYGYKGEDIPDPYFFNGYEGFEKVFQMIEVCVNELISVECFNKEDENENSK